MKTARKEEVEQEKGLSHVSGEAKTPTPKSSKGWKKTQRVSQVGRSERNMTEKKKKKGKEKIKADDGIDDRSLSTPTASTPSVVLSEQCLRLIADCAMRNGSVVSAQPSQSAPIQTQRRPYQDASAIMKTHLARDTKSTSPADFHRHGPSCPNAATRPRCHASRVIVRPGRRPLRLHRRRRRMPRGWPSCSPTARPGSLRCERRGGASPWVQSSGGAGRRPR
ncbi:hypothetical protein JOL62DRAFT_23099 [Phyllosticta paracitricarpa]|uniref:Uncharacterized protein n=1 Tax=Phyllosticta paracitricarpa TaxID=2016321 RepID=A0ABR1NB08_9PEZI